MYLLKLFEVDKIKYNDGSIAEKTTFKSLVFCKNKKELTNFLNGHLGAISVYLGKNNYSFSIVENDDNYYLKGAIIYSFNKSRILNYSDFDGKEIRYNLGFWLKKGAIKFIIDSINNI